MPFFDLILILILVMVGAVAVHTQLSIRKSFTKARFQLNDLIEVLPDTYDSEQGTVLILTSHEVSHGALADLTVKKNLWHELCGDGKRVTSVTLANDWRAGQEAKIVGMIVSYTKKKNPR